MHAPTRTSLPLEVASYLETIDRYTPQHPNCHVTMTMTRTGGTTATQTLDLADVDSGQPLTRDDLPLPSGIMAALRDLDAPIGTVLTVHRDTASLSYDGTSVTWHPDRPTEAMIETWQNLVS